MAVVSGGHGCSVQEIVLCTLGFNHASARENIVQSRYCAIGWHVSVVRTYMHLPRRADSVPECPEFTSESSAAYYLGRRPQKGRQNRDSTEV